GTAAAVAATNELATMRARPNGGRNLLDQAEQDLRASVADVIQRAGPISETLRAIDAFRPPPEAGPEFEARRAAFERERIVAAEEAVRARFDQATQLGLDGKFTELAAALEALEPLFAGLDELPGDPGRLAGLRQLRDDLVQRRGRVAEEKRFFQAEVERHQRATLGEALGPGSGLLAELGALELEAASKRLEALAPGLRE